MTRAALLPMGGDPFLNAYWLRHYRTWADKVDELRIVVCDQNDQAIQDYILEQTCKLPNVLIRFAPRTDHGEILKQLIEDTSADTVLLCEDDAFVRKPEKVDEFFRKIESGETDVVGCPRATGSTNAINWASERYGTWTATATGETGPLLWPCFLFAKREDLLRTDRCFGSGGWKAGESLLGKTFESDEAMDTFGWATLQLREMGLRFHIEANYRAERSRLSDWDDAPWFHVGGMSAGYGLYILGPEQHRAGFWASIRDTDLYDWQKRMSWWRRVVDKADGVLVEHQAAYKKALDEFMVGVSMNQSDVEQWRSGFDRLITWTE